MIRVVESVLDPGDRERWRVALTRPSIVARRKRPAEVEALVFALLLWSAAYAGTLGLFRDASFFDVASLRAITAAAWVVTLRAAFTRWRTRATTWVNGRYLYAWGYVEIEDGVMRVVPIDELAVSIRGRALGFVWTPFRVTLSAERWSTTLWLAADELDALVDALELRESFGVDDDRRGYRDARPHIGGPRALWPWSRASRDASWACAAALIGVVLPWEVMQIVPAATHTEVRPPAYVSFPYANAEDLRDKYTHHLASEGGPAIEHVDIALDPCSRHRVVVESVESYLTLALSTPRLGPLHPEALFPRAHPQPRARLWSGCTWEVDRAHGTFARAEARWALDRDGLRAVERRAVVDVSDVLRTIEMCRGFDRDLDVSPRGIAIASAALLHAVIALDVFESRGRFQARTAEELLSEACVVRAANWIAVEDRSGP